jgi:hypothetical protein
MIMIQSAKLENILLISQKFCVPFLNIRIHAFPEKMTEMRGIICVDFAYATRPLCHSFIQFDANWKQKFDPNYWVGENSQLG